MDVSPEVRSILKTLLVTLGASLASRGYIEESQVEIVAGALVTLAAAGWSAWVAYRTKTATKEIQNVAASRGIDVKIDGKLGQKTVTAVKEALTK